jgi:mycothiol synthase
MEYPFVMSFDNCSIKICPVSPKDRSVALNLIFSNLQPEERSRQIKAILSEFSISEHATEGLLGAYRGGLLVGSVFSQIQPGKNAQVWMPRLVQNEETVTAVSLLRATVERLEKSQVCLAQILLDSITTEEELVLNECGFDYLTNLLYLVCQEDEFPVDHFHTPLEFESYNIQNHDRLARIVDSTYQDTLDSPKLNNERKVEDVLEGYRATGEFLPDRWLIVRHETIDIGCLLLTDHPRYENMELIYMGIIPAVRGRRWGMDIARYAQSVAKQAGRRRLVLAVDASNSPAIEMYASVGFQAWDQRRVYYRIFSR